jgi:hypothetical protein
VELHRHWKLRLRGPLLLLAGGLFLLAPTLIRYEWWHGYPMGALLLFVGVLWVLDTRRPFLLRIDRYGVAWRIGRGHGSVPWHAVLGFAIENGADDPPGAKPNFLTLWLREPLPSAGTPDVSVPGRVGYRLVDVTDLAEPAEEIARELGWYVPPAVADGAHARPIGGSSSVVRPPEDGECAICGSTPAALVTLRALTSVVLLHWVTVRRAWWCRECASANYRELTDRTLAGCWWGFGVIGAPVVFWLNRRNMRLFGASMGKPD